MRNFSWEIENIKIFDKILLSRLIGLESSEDTTTSTTEESQTESSTEPCIGLCQLEKTNKIEKDPELNSLQSGNSKRCVGLCYILRLKIPLKLYILNCSLGKKDRKLIHIWKSWKKDDLALDFAIFSRKKWMNWISRMKISINSVQSRIYLRGFL